MGMLGETMTRREIEARWEALPPSDRDMLAPLRAEIEGYWGRCDWRRDLTLRMGTVGATRRDNPAERDFNRKELFDLSERLVRVMDYLTRRVRRAEVSPAVAPDGRGDEVSSA